MENKYQEGKIYKIVCNITGEIYIGSTTRTLEDRLKGHKTDKDCVSRHIIERGNYQINLIKDYPCNNLWELEEEEAKYIRNNKCINHKIPHRTKKQWNEENKEHRKKYGKKYRENNKEFIKELSIKYREENKEKLNIKKKEYYENNKKNILEKSNEKITCECGCIVRRGGMTKHRKTNKHIKLMKEKST